MNSRLRITLSALMWAAILIAAYAASVHAQNGAKDNHQWSRNASRDAWAEKHRINAEAEKPEQERGYYLHPEAYGKSEKKGIEWARRPELMQRMKEFKQGNRQQ
jgi:hypothetical protein